MLSILIRSLIIWPCNEADWDGPKASSWASCWTFLFNLLYRRCPSTDHVISYRSPRCAPPLLSRSLATRTVSDGCHGAGALSTSPFSCASWFATRGDSFKLLLVLGEDKSSRRSRSKNRRQGKKFKYFPTQSCVLLDLSNTTSISEPLPFSLPFTTAKDCASPWRR